MGGMAILSLRVILSLLFAIPRELLLRPQGRSRAVAVADISPSFAPYEERLAGWLSVFAAAAAAASYRAIKAAQT